MNKEMRKKIGPITASLIIVAAIGVGYVAGYQEGNDGDGPGLLKGIDAAQAQTAGANLVQNDIIAQDKRAGCVFE